MHSGVPHKNLNANTSQVPLRKNIRTEDSLCLPHLTHTHTIWCTRVMMTTKYGKGIWRKGRIPLREKEMRIIKGRRPSS